MDWDENVFLVKADIVVQIYCNIKALKKHMPCVVYYIS